jgi:hypothetical protein
MYNSLISRSSSFTSSSSSYSSNYNGSSSDESGSCVFKSVFKYSNPGLVYGRYFRETTFDPHRNFDDLYPEAITVWKTTRCDNDLVFLPEISKLIMKSCYVPIFECSRNEIPGFDNYLVDMYHRNDEYDEIDYSKPGFHHLDDFIIEDCMELFTLYPYYFSKRPLIESLLNGNSLSPLTCKHVYPIQERTVVPTSLTKGVGAGLYSAYNFITYNNSQVDIDKMLIRWSLELTQLVTNFSVTNLIFTFLKVLNEWFDIRDVADKTLQLFNKIYSYLNGSPTQSTSGNSVVATSLVTSLNALSSIQGSAVAIASAFGSIVIVFATLITGKDLSSIFDFNFTQVANALANMSKIKSGLAATKEMLLKFNSFLYETIFDFLGIECESHLVTLLRSSTVVESENCKKIEVFDYAKFLVNPDNLIVVQSNSAQRKRLEFTYDVLHELQFQIANQITSIPQPMVQYIKETMLELQKVRKAVSKTAKGQTTRFVPFWTNLIGESHTGKSSLTSIITKVLVTMLRKTEEQLGLDFEIPSEDNVEYHVNFCDKYETNYTGQYIAVIDDFAQDASGTLETNSALKMINWISNIPYSTNQAQLDNKGIPFVSKIIMSTSNDMSLANRKEIISRDALLNRMQLCFNFTLDESQPKHKWLPKKVRIDLHDFKNNKAIQRAITPERMIQIIYENYVAWFKKERMMEDLRKVEPKVIEDIMKDIPMLKIAVASSSSQTQNSEALSSSQQTQKSDTVLTPQPEITGAPSLPQQTINTEVVLPSQPEQTEAPSESPTQNSDKTVEATSRMWCRFGCHPGYKKIYLEYLGYDCDCIWHRTQNNQYIYYLQNNTDGRIYTLDEYAHYKHTIEKQIECLQNSLKNGWQRVKELTDTYLNTPYCKAIMGAVTLAISSTVLWNYLSQDNDETIVEPTAKYTIGVRRAKQKKAVIATSGLSNIEQFFNDSYCQNAANIAKDLIIKRGAICRLASKTQINTGLRIAGEAILSNHHFFNIIEEGSQFKIFYNDLVGKNHEVTQIFSRSRLERIDNTDLAVYNCDTSLPASKNIIKHFPNNEVMPQYQKSIVITADPTPMVYNNVIAKPTLVKAHYVMGEETYSTLDNYETNCPVDFGMSGSVLFSLNNAQKHKIIGIQTCRNNDGIDQHGYYKPVTQDQLNKALSKLKVSTIFSDIDKAVEGTSLILDNRVPPNLNNNSLTYLGTVPKTKQIKQQNVSKIIESMVHNIEERTQEPSVLSDHDERMNKDLIGKSIIFRAIEGFDHPIGSLDTRLLDKAAEWLTVEYDVMLDLRGIPRRILTDFEAINGVPGVFLRIDMKTSPGYPFVLERKQTTIGGKYEWFDEIDPPEGYGKAYQMKSSLARGLEQTEHELRNGDNPLFLAYACLKDETRPLDKIAKGKTRAFICLPLHYNLLIRKYFGAFTSALKLKAGAVSSCVGVDPAKDWKRIYHKLMAKSPLWEDFDYANWDQHLHPELVMKVAEVVSNWYDDGETNATVRRTLLYTLVHTFIIVKDRLFLKSQGQCSGCAITAELNCIIHDLLMVYVWLKYHRDNELETSLTEMRENVAICVYGDDIIMACDKEYVLPFNGNVIAPYMEELGMNITPGDKVSVTFDLKEPAEIFFLKRNFVRDGDKILAPLRSDIVENIIQWIHKSDDNIEATKVNCETALQESYMHGKQYFNKLVNEINSRIKAVNRMTPNLLQPVMVDYDALERKYIGGHFICAGLSERPAMME